MSPRDSAHRKLLALQRRIFQSLQAEADRLLGETPEPIVRYEREYSTDFRGRAVRCGKKELLRAIRAADVAWVADFHTFHQSQRTALRLIREAIRPGERWYIGLEMISSHHQEALDRFQAGKIDLETFHEIIRYDDEWGFPWRNYAPIFEWARERGIRLIALNRPKELSFGASASMRRARTDRDLHGRDQWAAGIITDALFAARDEGAPARMIVIYGELHVGSRHLPEQLTRISRAFGRKPLRSVAVHQNNDALYWKLASRREEQQTNVVRLRKNSYCVISTTPWAKLQSLISWAEGFAYDYDESAADPDEIVETDYLSVMRTYGNTVSEFLGVTPPSYESLSAQTVDNADFVDALEGEFSPLERSLIRFHVATNQLLYIPRDSIAYLGSHSQNGAAELASVHLFRSRTRSTELFVADPGDFYRMVLEAAFGYFGSLVINPRRKCDLESDHLKMIRARNRLRHPWMKFDVQARTLALTLLKAEPTARGGSSRSTARAAADIEKTLRTARTALNKAYRKRGGLPPMVLMMSARHLGRLLGKRMHQAVLTEIISPELIRHSCLARAEGSFRPFEERYAELLRAVAPARLAPSKTETL